MRTLNTKWLEFLHLYTAVRGAYLDARVASRVAPAQEELVEGGKDNGNVTRVTIFLIVRAPTVGACSECQ